MIVTQFYLNCLSPASGGITAWATAGLPVMPS